MLSQEEYKQIKELGESIGYLLESNLDNLEDNYELKTKIVNISKNFAVTHDTLFLKNNLYELNINDKLKESLYKIILGIVPLKEEGQIVYSNNVYIPDNEEFINNYYRYRDLKTLSELYHVPQTVIAAKTLEVNKYGKKEEKSQHIA